MMQLFNEYQKILRESIYYKDQYKKIYLIFAGKGGNQVINEDIVPQGIPIDKILILNQEMKNALSYILDEVTYLQNNDTQYSSYLFYFSQYGGSKTQFLNLVKSKININAPNAIIVHFEDITEINVKNLFNKIISQIFYKITNIPRFIETPSKYKEFFDHLNELIGAVQIALNQSKNLSKAENIIKEIYKIKNPEIRLKLEELNRLLHESILIDNLSILEKIKKVLQYCSQEGFIFLFLFDEVDLWLDDANDTLRFSDSFQYKSNLMKKIIEFPDSQIKTFLLFASTDRVNKLFQSSLIHNMTVQSPVASRLKRIFDSAEKILEPGNYGDAIESAFVKLSAYHSIYYEDNNTRIEQDLFEKIIPPLKRKYKSLSRRICNAKILSLLRNYEILKHALKRGKKDWENNTKEYGNLIQEYLPSILKRLSIKFIRSDVSIDKTQKITRDKIDGYFVHIDVYNKETKIFVEIKVTKEFKGEKAYQALEWVQINKNKPLVFILFTPTPIDKIKAEIISYAEKNNFDLELLNKIQILQIDEPFGFYAINGMKNAPIDPKGLEDFFQAYANWLDFFGDFTEKFQKIKGELGLDQFTFQNKNYKQNTYFENKNLENEENNEENFTDLKNQNGQDLNKYDKQNNHEQENIHKKLSVDKEAALNLLAHMFSERIFNQSGRVSKSKIEKLIANKGLGIADLDRTFEILKRSDIILKITNKFVTFLPEFHDYLSLDKVIERGSSLLSKKNKSSTLNF